MLDPAAKSWSCTYDLTGTNDVTQVRRTISSQSRAAKVIWFQLKMSLRERNQHFSSVWSHTVGQTLCKPGFKTLSQSLRLKSPGDTPVEAAEYRWGLLIVQIKSRLGPIKDEKEQRSGLLVTLEGIWAPWKGLWFALGSPLCVWGHWVFCRFLGGVFSLCFHGMDSLIPGSSDPSSRNGGSLGWNERLQSSEGGSKSNLMKVAGPFIMWLTKVRLDWSHSENLSHYWWAMNSTLWRTRSINNGYRKREKNCLNFFL